MPIKDRSGQVNVVLDPTLLAEVREFSEARGATLKNTFERALRRHLDNPPPLPPKDPPLPDAPPETVPEKPAKKPRAPRKPRVPKGT